MLFRSPFRIRGDESKSWGRLARLLATITQRPTIGSLRKSGIVGYSLKKNAHRNRQIGHSQLPYACHIINSRSGDGTTVSMAPSWGTRSIDFPCSKSSTKK